MFFLASAYLSLGSGASYYAIPWKNVFFIPVALYLLACLIKGLRFAVLFQKNGEVELRGITPYQEALSLNNIAPTYLTDLFLFWFYRPFVNAKRSLGAIALSRVCDTIILLPGFLYFAFAKGGLWAPLALGCALWGGACLAFLLARYGNLFKKRFGQTLVLSVLAWAVEFLAVSTFFLFHLGGDLPFWKWGIKSVYDVFIRGPHLAYQWFYLAHFIAAFAGLLLLKYRKD